MQDFKKVSPIGESSASFDLPSIEGKSEEATGPSANLPKVQVANWRLEDQAANLPLDGVEPLAASLPNESDAAMKTGGPCPQSSDQKNATRRAVLGGLACALPAIALAAPALAAGASREDDMKIINDVTTGGRGHHPDAELLAAVERTWAANAILDECRERYGKLSEDYEEVKPPRPESLLVTGRDFVLLTPLVAIGDSTFRIASLREFQPSKMVNPDLARQRANEILKAHDDWFTECDRLYIAIGADAAEKAFDTALQERDDALKTAAAMPATTAEGVRAKASLLAIAIDDWPLILTGQMGDADLALPLFADLLGDKMPSRESLGLTAEEEVDGDIAQMHACPAGFVPVMHNGEVVYVAEHLAVLPAEAERGDHDAAAETETQAA